MSLKRNVAANYVSQLYVTAVGILILPLYVKYMGAEAYGLIGFFTMLQSWFQLLDVGLTQTVGRETARHLGGSTPTLFYRRLYRSLSVIFLGTAVFGGGALWLLAPQIATNWLSPGSLPTEQVILALKIMGVCVALRWLGGLFRGVITGSERLVWLSGFNVLFASLRFVAVFATMWLYGFTPLVFFLHQLIIAILEVCGLCWMSRRLLPTLDNITDRLGWSFKPVRDVLGFALTIALTSSLWTMVTQTDKLVLSGVLPLSEYGYFTLAVMVASGIVFISGPVSLAVLPKMSRLYAEGDRVSMIRIYRTATRTVITIAGSAAIVIAFFPEALLFAWTGDPELASEAAPILRLYALGNGILAASSFPYYLQYASGRLKYHLIGSLLLLVLLVPSIVWAASRFGGVGAGSVWLSLNILFFLFWVGFVHSRLEPGLHLRWLLRDVLAVYLPATLVAWAVYQTGWHFESRLGTLMILAGTGLAALTAAAISARGPGHLGQIWKKASQ
ncbi:oligosaccharide flippase family protein [Alcanivorax marinus]|nr:oligosaccharide flippase family protein [Alloalcanivorax marinus]